MNERTLRNILAEFPGKKILIVGDVMLDEYISGDVRRISPEAPIPVVEIKQRTYHPGGAGNVAANVAALGGVPVLCGIIGKDAMGSQLIRVLAEHKVSNDVGLISSLDRPTTVKSRIVAQSQQMLRLDTESQNPIARMLEESILSCVERHITRASVCVISDYAKGVLTERVCRAVIQLVCDAGKPVIIDPKGSDYTKYRGAHVITPNVHEAGRVLNTEIKSRLDLGELGHLLDILEGSALLITRGAEGMSLFMSGSERIDIPAMARNVFDVTGAGDTVVSALALGVAAGATLEQAARLANYAAGIVVGKLGTAAVTFDELMAGGLDGQDYGLDEASRAASGIG